MCCLKFTVQLAPCKYEYKICHYFSDIITGAIIPAWYDVCSGGTACSRLRMLHAPCSIGLDVLCIMFPQWTGELRCDSLWDSIKGTLICVVACRLLASMRCTSLLLRGRRTRSFKTHTVHCSSNKLCRLLTCYTFDILNFIIFGSRYVQILRCSLLFHT